MTTMQRPALADLADPKTLPDPYPVLAGLRAASPFAEADGALVVAGKHADIATGRCSHHQMAAAGLAGRPSCPSIRPITRGCGGWCRRHSRRG